MVGSRVKLILISQPVMSFKFGEALKCLVYSYRTYKIQAHVLSINTGQVLYISWEWTLRKIANPDNLTPETCSFKYH